MAIYHCHFQIISRKAGRSVVASVAYRAGEKLTNEYDGSITNALAYRSGNKITTAEEGQTFDYTRKRGIVYSEILLPDNAPREYLDLSTFCNAIETKERRRDAQLARECEISLPVELNTTEQIALVKDYIWNNFVDKGICAHISIHDKKDGNPHAHVILTMRYVNEKGFGKRRAEEQGVSGYMQRHRRIKQWRKEWADTCNKHLEIKGFSARVDHRTLQAQGIDREPKKYLGLSYKHKKSLEITERFRGEGEPFLNNVEIKRIERQIERLEITKNELLHIQNRIIELQRNRANAKNQSEIDEQVFKLKRYAENAVNQVEREVEQMNRVSIKPQVERLSRERPNRELEREQRRITNKEKLKMKMRM